METAFMKAIALLLSADAELMNILRVTAEMSLQSSVIALLLGVPLGILLGNCRFPGRGILLVVNRTLMGLPSVVCGLLFYMLFSGVGPFRHLKLLFLRQCEGAAFGGDLELQRIQGIPQKVRRFRIHLLPLLQTLRTVRRKQGGLHRQHPPTCGGCLWAEGVLSRP